MKLRILLAALAAALANTSFGFGHEGHETIGILATQKLTADAANNVPGAQAALDHIQAILGNTNLGAGGVATWADYIRLKEWQQVVDAGFATDKTSALAYIKDIAQRFPGQSSWHFCDLPLGATQYQLGAAGTNGDDVVHGLNKCIAMLESPDTSAQKDVHACALRFIVHLTGDISQPLHVASGYDTVGSSTIVTDPAAALAQHLPDDRGANELLTKPAIPPRTPGGREEKDELHATWDSALVWILAGKKSSVDASVLAQALQPTMTSTTVPLDPSDYNAWPTAWATDSIAVANKAYQGITIPTITGTQVASDGHLQINEVVMVGFDKDAYVAAHRDESAMQIIKAANRLANLLERIQWAD